MPGVTSPETAQVVAFSLEPPATCQKISRHHNHTHTQNKRGGYLRDGHDPDMCDTRDAFDDLILLLGLVREGLLADDLLDLVLDVL